MDSSSNGIEGAFSCNSYAVDGFMPYVFACCRKNTHRAVFVARLRVSWRGGCSSYELERERHDAQI